MKIRRLLIDDLYATEYKPKKPKNMSQQVKQMHNHVFREYRNMTVTADGKTLAYKPVGLTPVTQITAEFLSGDKSAKAMLWNIKEHSKKKKTYYVSSNLWDVLGTMKSEIKLGMLPTEFVAYFAFKPGFKDMEGYGVEGVFVALITRDGEASISTSWLSSDGGVNFATAILNRGNPEWENRPLKDAYDSMDYTIRENKSSTITPGEEAKGKHNMFALRMLSLVVYASKTTEEKKEYIPNFSGSAMAQKLQAKNLSGHTISILGNDIELLSLPANYTANSWESSPYWCMKPCGPGLNNVKLTYVKGCMKERNSDLTKKE